MNLNYKETSVSIPSGKVYLRWIWLSFFCQIARHLFLFIYIYFLSFKIFCFEYLATTLWMARTCPYMPVESCLLLSNILSFSIGSQNYSRSFLIQFSEPTYCRTCSIHFRSVHICFFFKLNKEKHDLHNQITDNHKHQNYTHLFISMYFAVSQSNELLVTVPKANTKNAVIGQQLPYHWKFNQWRDIISLWCTNNKITNILKISGRRVQPFLKYVSF